MKKLFLSFLKDEEGQTTIEYVLMLAVVVLILMKFRETAQSKMDSVTGKIFEKVETVIDAMN